eukprot:CAMPEP_0184697538 /NCGR_PEP_ID=MMETSP0313-20130426/4478_1 /TAXON_ID=2792 /ORGANISM="Porphyridium aerugineum, Strain SAG 1380-2" /LENGTH=301 /DNA_ID=CAMNT_0027156349 /DNA_START=58 /DNA_END=963 /DNA_ORIENTATION=+
MKKENGALVPDKDKGWVLLSSQLSGPFDSLSKSLKLLWLPRRSDAGLADELWSVPESEYKVNETIGVDSGAQTSEPFAELQFMPSAPKESRIVVLTIRCSPKARRHYFWMQEPNPDEDASIVELFNEIISSFTEDEGVENPMDGSTSALVQPSPAPSQPAGLTQSDLERALLAALQGQANPQLPSSSSSSAAPTIPSFNVPLDVLLSPQVLLPHLHALDESDLKHVSTLLVDGDTIIDTIRSVPFAHAARSFSRVLMTSTSESLLPALGIHNFKRTISPVSALNALYDWLLQEYSQERRQE